MKALVFDMDGTLVDSHELAYRSALDGLRGFYEERRRVPILPSREEVRALVGLPSLEYFARLVSPEFRREAPEIRARVSEEEVRRLAAGEAALYPGVRETLEELRREWKLGLVSNCGRVYFEANLRTLLDGLFGVALCLDDGPSKTENVRAALRRLDSCDGVMVGDRAADLEAGRASGLATVGCAYGFGTREELASADAVIETFPELRIVLTRFRNDA